MIEKRADEKKKKNVLHSGVSKLICVPFILHQNNNNPFYEPHHKLVVQFINLT